LSFRPRGPHDILCATSAARTAELLYLFEDCALNTQRRELRRGGRLIAVEPQVFDLLVYLVNNRDRVVSKDDLFSAVWEGRIVSESALTTRINAARTAVGDSGEAQRLIRTFRRKGIRFVGAVREAPTPAAAIPAPIAPEQSRPGLLVLPDKPSIVVLPFANLSDDPNQDYFADGMVAEITIALGRIPWLFVISSTSAFTYKGRLIDAKQVGAELGVRYVLEGSVRKNANRVRIAVELIDASNGSQIWADRLDGELADVFEMQDRVAVSVSAKIVPKLRSAEVELARRKPTVNLTAYDLFLRALPPHRDNLAQNEESLELLYRAIELDPSFAAAYGLAAYCYYIQTVFGWLTPADSRSKEGLRLAYLAVEKGENDPEALWMAARAIAALAGNIEHGLALIEKSLSLNPNSANAWWMSGMFYAYLGQADTAFEHFGHARRLNPVDPSGHAHWLGMALANFFSGQYAEARVSIDKALAEWPTSTPALQDKAAICGLMGQIEEGGSCVQQLLASNPRWNVSAVRSQFEPRLRKHPRGLESYLRGLRQSGLPEGDAS
jgi:TolB-like protein/Tfp pilus assembly protein PilF